MTELTLPILISICSLAFSVYIFLSNNNKDETSKLTKVLVKLETIADSVTEIKTDVRSIRSEIKDVRERLAKVESSVSSAHKRIDALEMKDVH